MSHSFLPWMRHWARMVNNNRYGLLIKEHGRITRAFSRQRSTSLRSLRAAADAPIVSRPEEGTFWAGKGPSGGEACFGYLGARVGPSGPANLRIQPTALRFAALAPRCG
jgi:hypothetical protein